MASPGPCGLGLVPSRFHGVSVRRRIGDDFDRKGRRLLRHVAGAEDRSFHDVAVAGPRGDRAHDDLVPARRRAGPTPGDEPEPSFGVHWAAGLGAAWIAF